MANDTKPSDDDRELLRERVRTLLEAAGSSQRKVETECGWASGTLSRVFGGRKAVDAEVVAALAKALSTDPAALVAGTAYAALLGAPSSEADEQVTTDASPGRAKAPKAAKAAAKAPKASSKPKPAPKEKPEVERPEEDVPKPAPGPEIEAPTRSPKPEIEQPVAPEPELKVVAPEPKPVPEAAQKPAPAEVPQPAEPAVAAEAAVAPEAAEETPRPGGVRGFFKNIARKVWGG